MVDDRKPSKVTSALLEITAEMRNGGLIDDARHAAIVGKLTKHGRKLEEVAQPLTGEETRAVRERAN